MSDDEDLTTAAPYRYQPERQPVRDDDEPIPYPRPQRLRPPPELSRRQRRGWQREQRQLQRDREQQAIAGWRAQTARNASGLGLPVLLVALVIAGYAFWPRPDEEPRSAAAPPATSSAETSTPATSSRSSAPSSTAAPSSSTVPPGELDGGDADTPPAPPAELSGPDGVLAYDLLLNWNSYSPAYPDPVSNWIGGWAGMATDDVIDRARTDAARLWDWTAREVVSIAPQRVENCTVVAEIPGDDTRTWECDVVRTWFPIGSAADAQTYDQIARFRVTVTGGETGDPVATSIEELLATAVTR